MLTKNKQGFTIVELIIVLLLLSFGVLALANMFKVTYRAFQKSEERSIKQEAVKLVAEMLNEGQTNVAAAMSADIFDTTEVIPPTTTDTTYSYLFFEPHAPCKSCGAAWNFDSNTCSMRNDSTAPCSSTSRDKVDGYFLKCMNKGQTKAQALLLSDIPLYVTFEPMQAINPGETELSNQCGVLIKIAALENDFVYGDDGTSANPTLNNPISDDIYYSLDVAYHFPNMVLAESGITVNQQFKGVVSTAKTYNRSGTEKGKAEAVDEGGVVLRIYSDAIISGDSANAQITTPTLCFIATASYGHDSGEVGLLCNFRDKCLLTNPLGTAFVKAYYKLSPPLADFISESEPLKAAVRIALKPLVAIATNALDEDAAKQNAPWFVVFMLCGAGATATLIKVDKRRKKIK